MVDKGQAEDLPGTGNEAGRRCVGLGEANRDLIRRIRGRTPLGAFKAYQSRVGLRELKGRVNDDYGGGAHWAGIKTGRRRGFVGSEHVNIKTIWGRTPPGSNKVVGVCGIVIIEERRE